VSLNLKKLAAKVEKIAFDLASDLVQNAVYSQTTDPKYNATTGAEVSPTVPTANVSAMILQFDEKEIDGKEVKVGDERVLIRAVDFGALVPDLDDEMLGADNIKRQVIGVTLDATKTLYTFHMRRVAA
jgi:hypothetical protein